MDSKIWPEIAQKLVLIILLFTIWGIGYSIFYENVGINSEIVMLCVLFIGAKITGYLVSLIKCPAILGQMFFGVLLQNINYFHLSAPFLKFTSILRQVALVNIMLPAGLNLDPKLLKQWSFLAVLLAIMPALVEILIMTGLAYGVLHTPILWAILMGLILAAVSPSVIFPCLFHLEDLGYGLEKGVNTLVVAASTINDIISIAVFIAHVGIIFSDEPSVEIINGPIGFVIGLVFGTMWGYMAQTIPHKSDTFVITLRTLLIGIGSLFICLGSNAIGYSSAGALGCIVSAFIASQGWRKEGWIGDKNPIKFNFMILWKFFEPISFGLIGVEVKLHLLQGFIILWITCISLIALLGRVIASFLVGYLGNFTLNEKIFFAICAIPKATVQAALGPLALEKAMNKEDYDNAMNVLILSVISIILTAPIGAWLILYFGPKLLPQTSANKERISLENQDI